MLTSKLVTEIIENHSEFYVCAVNFFQVDLDKSWNYVWYCYARAPVPPLSKGREGSTPCNAPPFRRPWLCAKAWVDTFR